MSPKMSMCGRYFSTYGPYGPYDMESQHMTRGTVLSIQTVLTIQKQNTIYNLIFAFLTTPTESGFDTKKPRNKLFTPKIGYKTPRSD